jgi:hypothetical protein
MINAHVTDTASMDVHATTKFHTITQIAVEMLTSHHQKTKNVSSFGKTKLKIAEITVLLSLSNASLNATKMIPIVATSAKSKKLNAKLNVHVTNNVHTDVHVQFSKTSPISVLPLNPFHLNVLKIGLMKSQNALAIAKISTMNVFVTVATLI